MKSNLKVSHKVFLGFGIIVLTLVCTGLIFINKFSTINKSTILVTDTAVPVQKQSNQLQIRLLKLVKFSTLSFNSQTTEQVDASIKQFNQDAQLLNEEFKQLSDIVKDQRQAKILLDQAQQSTQKYASSVKDMLSAIKTRLEFNDKAKQSHDKIYDHIDEAAALLMELSYLEGGGSAADLERLSGAASQLDGYLTNVLNTAKEVRGSTDIAQVNKSKESIEFMISNLNISVDHLKKLAEGINTNGILEQFESEYQLGLAQLTGEDSLLYNKSSQLSMYALSKQKLDNAEAYVSEAIATLDKLLNQSDQQFNQLQTNVLDELDAGQTVAKFALIIQTLVAIAAAVLTTRVMLNPLDTINNILSYMAQGDLSRKIDSKKRDEYGKLSGNINNVVEDLTRLITLMPVS